MRQSTYERVCRISAIAIMLIAIAIWTYYFRELYELLIFYDMEYSIFEIFRGWYAQILQLLAEIVGIILLLALKKKGLPVILGVCALVLALECAIDAYLLLVEYKQIFDSDPVDFFQGALSLVIAAMLFFNAILYSMRATKSATLIKYAAIILILLQLLGIITELRAGYSFHDILIEREFDFPSYLLLILVLQMSVSKFTKQTSLMGVVKSSFRDMRNSLMTEGIGIDRSTVLRLSDYNKNGLWCSSYSFLLAGFEAGIYSMSLVSVGDGIVGRVSSAENGSGMNVFRFRVTGVWFDSGDPSTCDVMRFYGTDGLFIQLIVRDSIALRPRGVPIIGAVNLSSREEGTATNKLRVKISIVIGFVRKHVRRFVNFVKTNTVGRIRNLK